MTEKELQAGAKALEQYLRAQSAFYASMVSEQQYRDGAYFVIDAVDAMRETQKETKP